MPHLTSLAGLLLAQSEGGGGNILSLLLPLLIVGGLFYFLMIAPQRRRARQLAEVRDNLDIGDEIRTVGGIYGVVAATSDDEITLDVGGGTELRIARRAIAEVLGEDEEA